MQFIDLNKQYEKLKEKIDLRIKQVLQQANYIMGEEVRILERDLAEYVGVKHCITCANGTDALILALGAYDIKVGDAVFVPTFTFYASAETISAKGATPIFVDIDRKTFNIDIADLEDAIRKVNKEGQLRAKAIMVVDLFGLPANFEEINKLAKRYNLLVIEDGAQGFGGKIRHRRSCSFGDIATTSFFPAKPLGCYGDGGAIFTNDDKTRDYIESIKTHGKGLDKYDNVRIGMNSRLDTIQAAVLITKLEAFNDYELSNRWKIAELYKEHLGQSVTTPFIPNGYKSSYAQYSILLETETQRNEIASELKRYEIPTMVYYKKSMHQQPVYRNNQSIYRGFPNAEYVSSRILNLPMHPYLMDEDVRNISNKILDFINV